jgi:group I intron endonuclease
MNNKVSGIYSITSKTNNNRYIGSSVSINKRWNEHKFLLKNNSHHSTYLQNHFNKYGIDDLIFEILEIIEKDNLSTKEFKTLLLEKEQTYLNDWKNCQFNINKKADSCLGSKHIDANYYRFCTTRQKYRVYYRVKTKDLMFGVFNTEQEAIDQVNYIKTLTEEELIEFHKLNYKGKTSIGVKSKNGCKGYRKKANNWAVEFTIHSKFIYLGSYKTEQEAKEKAEYFKTLKSEELINLYELNYKGKRTRINTCKGYSKHQKSWRVRFIIDGKEKYFGSYKTEEEAKQKAEEVKKELGGFY